MKTHETHLPTKQTPPQEDNRLSRPHENCRGPQGDQPPPPPRSQKALCLSKGSMTTGSFPKGKRLRSRREFQRVTKQGKRLVGRFLCLDCLPSGQPRLGISASSRYGSAPERNRFKRLVREAFRTSYASLPSIDLHIVPRQDAKKATLADISDDISRLLLAGG